jgi:AbrB family looped-hinge helix DNA binding protein
MRALENAPIAEDPSLEVTGLEVELAQKVKIIEGGKLVIPGAMRRALGIARGDTVVVELLPQGELRVRPLSAAVREAQVIVRKAVQGHRSLAEELMRERKRDAVSE